MTASRDLAVNIDRSPDAMAAYRLAQAIRRDGGNPRGVMELLAKVVEDRAWEHLRDNHGEPFTSFTAFVTSPDPGLGTTTAQLQALLRLRHPHEDADPEWRERAPKLRREVDHLLAADVPEAAPAAHAGPGRGHKTDRGTIGFEEPRSETAEYQVARLKRDDPELAERVVAGEITPHAAAREKGWRPPRIELRSTEKIAEKLREHLSADEIEQLIKILILTNDS